MTQPPSISVVMTLFNKGDFVEEALGSVLASDFPDFELLVIDDASRDDGPKRVLAFDDPRVRLLPHSTNTGRAAAANRGFEAAKGEFIAILDADDRMLPDRLGKQLRFMRADPDVIACGSAARIMGRGEHRAAWPLTDRECRARLVFEDAFLYGSCMLRRERLDQHRIRCEEGWRTPGMDYLLQLTLARHGRLANLPEALTEYRIHDRNMRSGRDPVQDKLVLQRRVFEHLGIQHSDQELQDHLLLHRMGVGNLDPRSIRRLRAWTKRLIHWNAAAGFADEAMFRETIRAYWDHLFYVLPDLGFWVTWRHFTAWWPWRTAHAAYWAKHLAKRSRPAR